MPDDTDALLDTERLDADCSLLRVVLIANALNETRRSAALAAVSGAELTALCRPLLVKLRELCSDALGCAEHPN